MKSDENVLGKGIEAIFQRTAYLRQGGEKTLELPNGMIRREGDELIIRLSLGDDEDIRGAVEDLHHAAQAGVLDSLVDLSKIKDRLKEHLKLAFSAAQDGDYEAAEQEYKNALRGFESPEILYNLAFVCEELKKPETAIKYYVKALKLAADDVPTLNNLGILYYKKGDFDKAMDLYNQALKVNPSMSGKAKTGDLFGPRFGLKKISD